jgi:hypothetical protein
MIAVLRAALRPGLNWQTGTAISFAAIFAGQWIGLL